MDEALAHLRLLAGQQHRDVDLVAADVIAALEAARFTPSRRLRRAADEALRTATAAAPRHRRPADREPAEPGWAGTVQRVLDVMAGEHSALAPVREDGRVVDYEFVAVSPTVVDLSGHTGTQPLGRRVSEAYPTVVGGPVWRAWSDALADGQLHQVGPFPYVHDGPSGVSEHLLTVRVQPIGDGLLNSWIRHDEQTRLAERIAQTERLGALGWGEWDLVTNATVWSDELYRSYERNPADGPLPREESEALTLPDDEPLRRQAAEAFGRGETVDVTSRIRINGKVKHLRAVVDAVRDVNGRPLKIYGIIQDVTARETSQRKLAEVEQRLREHQQDLAAEHRRAVQLQQIVLPIPDAPIDLPGLQAAVRYLPAEQASRVGGDWYHAAVAADGSVILAVGDVAGHGMRAATTMAKLRHALAALSVTTTAEPATLLGHLNQLLYTTGAETDTATAVIVRFEPASRDLTWSQAGHPAPLLARGGVTTELPRPPGPLLGALPSVSYDTAALSLQLGDLLLLYTDGLVEARSHTITDGLAPVIALLSRSSGRTGQRPLADMLAELRRANPADDTCILAARPVAPASAPRRGPRRG